MILKCEAFIAADNGVDVINELHFELQSVRLELKVNAVNNRFLIATIVYRTH